jgi:SAM-dependent methyltransferase/uncharacterized protein YbaR (Trm112 family)
MQTRLLQWLRCPVCGATLTLTALEPADEPHDVETGLLACEGGHLYPVMGGVPRMLPDALEEHHAVLRPHLATLPPAVRDAVTSGLGATHRKHRGSDRTRENFSLEWERHEPGDHTWGIPLADRVRWYLVDPIRIAPEELRGKVLLDAGCGNGSQSTAYTELGLEVIALDVSSGVELGHAFRHRFAGADPDRVHFVQGDLNAPPIAPGTIDIIHSAGVLHHAGPRTDVVFRGLTPLLRPGGTFYVWLYKYEPVVTPVVNGLRFVTTRLPPAVFSRLATLLAPLFQLFCWLVNRLGIRAYPVLSRREAALSLMDIFGAPYANYHSYDEVREWFESEGFGEVWPCNDDRRGFGTCGRLQPSTADSTAAPRPATTP